MMGWNDGWGVGSWIGMGMGMVLFWGLVIVAIVALLRWSGGDRRDGGAMTQAPVSGSAGPAGTPAAGSAGALRTLQERFARGDLTEEEYRTRRDVLLER